MLSRTMTSGRQSATASIISGSAVRAWRPTNTSRITSSDEVERLHRTSSTSSAGASPTARWGRPARSTSFAADAGAANSTSWPARRQACAKGTSGPTWPAPRVLAKRTLTPRRTARGRRLFPQAP